MINLTANNKNYLYQSKFNPKTSYSFNMAFGVKEEPENQKNNGINKKILIGIGITAGGF